MQPTSPARDTPQKPTRVGGAVTFARELIAFGGWTGLVAFAAACLATVCEGLGVLMIIPLLDRLTGSASPGLLGQFGAALLPGGRTASLTHDLLVLAIVATALLAVRALVIWLRDSSLARLQVGFVEHLRGGLISAMTSADWLSLAKLEHARYAQLLGADLQRCGAAAQFLTQAVVGLAIVLIQLALAFVVSPAMTGLALALAILCAPLVWPLAGRARRLGLALSQDNLTLASRTAQFLGGLKLTLSHNRQGDFLTQTQAASHDLAGHQIAFLQHQSRMRIAVTTLSVVLSGAVLLFGFFTLHLSAPVLVAFVALISRTTGPALQLQQSVQQLVHALPAYQAVREAEWALAARPTFDPVPGPGPPLVGPIRFEDVTFCYDVGGEVGVHGLRFQILPGSLVAFAGPSGSGKTTTADLLTGLLAPLSGSIAVGGEPLTGTALGAWQARLAYVPQDLFLLHDTVRANLRWGRADATDQAMWSALETVGADGVVRGLEAGLDTVVGERGVRLSGGERQRLVLARALLREPDLLILDEAMSALPLDDERRIVEAVRAQRPGLTMVIVTHRPETQRLCDPCLTFERGRLTPGPVPTMMTSGGGLVGATVSERKT